jgi:regulatory protein
VPWRRRPKDGDRPPPNARDSALRLLSRREHSARELKRKLIDRGVEATDADAAIETLSSRGFQSDDRYAEQMVRTRITQGYGPLRIEAELKMAGLSGDQISQALEAAECDWLEQAARAHEKRFGAVPTSMAERNRQYRFLMGRGFESDQIRRVLKGEVED